MKNWKLVKTKSCFQSIPFDVVEFQFKKPNNGGKMKAYVIQSPNWVNVIGLNKRKEVLLIRQFRFGTKKIELEIPGGIIEKGEKPLKAAKREFEEETGYKSEDWKQIGMVDANPAIMNNKCYTFLAKNISATGKINFDPDEMIEHEFYPLEQVDSLIRNGKITNTYIIAAFYWLRQYYDQLEE